MDAAPSQRLNNFDLLRLLAATQVMITHGFIYLGMTFPPGLCPILDLLPGVPVFFLMSGFLIAGSLERNPGQLKQYLRNRALRIFPALWLCLAVSVFSVLVIRPEIFAEAGTKAVATWLVCQATFLQFWNPEFLRPYGNGVLNGSLWTIPVEMQFYLVLPALYSLLGLRRHSRHGLLLVLVVILWCLNAHAYVASGTELGKATWFKLYRQSFIPNLSLFLAGVLVQRNFARLYPWFAGRALFWFAFYVPVVLLTYWAQIPFNPVATALMVFFVMSCAFTRPGLGHRLLGDNDISYGTYLYHMVVINALRECGFIGKPAAFLLLMPVTYGLAALSWRLVEKPALLLKAAGQPSPKSHRRPTGEQAGAAAA